MIRFIISWLLLFFFSSARVENYPLIINVDSRQHQLLNGSWNVIVDPYETGYYNYRYLPTPNGFFKNYQPKDKSELVEYNFDSDQTLIVPGDWNSQREMLFLYEGTVWYKKSFSVEKNPNNRYFLYFGAVNYHAHVYLNGELIGEHEGGFTPFNFEVTGLLKKEDNFVILKVDNKRKMDGVPTVNTDWFNYGGITRRVLLLEVPKTFVRDYVIQLKRGTPNIVEGWIQLDGRKLSQKVALKITGMDVHKNFQTNNDGFVSFSFEKDLQLWSPQNPKLYDVIFETEAEKIKDRIGFRSIETQGTNILLNGLPIFLKGICIHEEAPFKNGARAFAKEHAEVLLNWAKELNCNFVRLAHYPHNEFMVRTADEMGLLIWSEIPVYWTIQWDNPETYKNAQNQLTEMITRDKNRASIILWSLANETPYSEARFNFLKNLSEYVRQADPTRLITAAMERRYLDKTTQMIDDPFGEFVDVLGINAYLGWYDGLADKCDKMKWKTIYNQPHIISEFGAGALFGYHADKLTRWSEEFQEDVYKANLCMFEKAPFVCGLSPWILKDFRSPRRPLPRIQDFWNRKGLVSDNGGRKKAFYVLQKYYKNAAESKN